MMWGEGAHPYIHRMPLVVKGGRYRYLKMTRGQHIEDAENRKA